MKTALLVSLGSAIGGICRYGMSVWMAPAKSGFPLATFAVNVLGCALIGALTAFAVKGAVSSDLRFFLGAGILGGFTTFSAFANESVALLREGQTTTAAIYISASVIAGLLCAFAGYAAFIRQGI
jgi:CrcB protein